MIARKRIFAGGSGSIYIMGYLDAHFRPNMSREECLTMIKNGIYFILLKQIYLNIYLS